VAYAPVRPIVLQLTVMPVVPMHFALFEPTPLMELSREFQSVQAFLSDSQLKFVDLVHCRREFFIDGQCVLPRAGVPGLLALWDGLDD
jgi:hypothetical protein